MLTPDDKSPTCLVSTRDGVLVSLKYVYCSWKKDRFATVPGRQLPAFKDPSGTEMLTLSSPTQIALLNTIFLELGFSNEPPFKLQFKKEINDPWKDINLNDQIKLASVMFSMQHNLSETPDKRMTEHRIVQDNQLLVSVCLFQPNKYSFEIKEIKNEIMNPLISRMLVLDDSFEF